MASMLCNQRTNSGYKKIGNELQLDLTGDGLLEAQSRLSSFRHDGQFPTHSGLSARQIQRPLADSTPQQRGIVAWRIAKCFLVFTAELRCTDIPAGVGDFSNVGLA